MSVPGFATASRARTNPGHDDRKQVVAQGIAVHVHLAHTRTPRCVRRLQLGHAHIFSLQRNPRSTQAAPPSSALLRGLAGAYPWTLSSAGMGPITGLLLFPAVCDQAKRQMARTLLVFQGRVEGSVGQIGQHTPST